MTKTDSPPIKKKQRKSNPMSKLVVRMRTCNRCGRFECYTRGCCYLCKQWQNLPYRAKEVSLTEQEFRDIMLNAKSCPDSGYEFRMFDPSSQRRSLDRLDNSRGYHKDNVRVVCAWVNRARMDATMEEWEQRRRQLAMQFAAGNA